MAHLLKYDSVTGPFPGDVKLADGKIHAGDDSFQVLSERDPSQLPWGDLGVDVVIESTGFFTARDKAQAHIDAGAKKVVISAPATEPDVTIVLGVNDDAYDAASSTTSSRTPRARRTASRRSRRCSTTPSGSSRAS